MALHDIKPIRVTVVLGDDKEHEILFDLNALAELEEKYGSLDDAFGMMQKGSIKATRTMLWAGLLHEDEGLSERDVGKLIDVAHLGDILDAITQAMGADLPETENANAAEPAGTADPR